MENFENWPILAGVSSPSDLKALPSERLDALAAEIRDYLVFRVGENGGHLASNLGVVELTLAIHRVFDLPRDHLVFDVGHQSYVHKLITGRKEAFDTLRRPGGISGFTKRAESEYDAFGAGHSSTAVSAALGLAEADALRGSDAYTVAVIGDGALTGGLSYEGLNNCRSDLNLILIINENEMSISPNTGRLARHLSKIRASHKYIKSKELASGAIRHFPLLGKPIYKVLHRVKRRVKHMLYHENLFEHMGIRYLGPVESHDVQGLEACLKHARKMGGCVLLHLKTKKGQGYAPAEQDANTYHSLSPAGKKPLAASFSKTFGEELVKRAGGDERICAITAAMSCGTGLEPFRAAYPKRFFDVGIAEGHAVTFAAGLAAGGLRPVVAVYSTFLQRAVDNVLHDAALQKLPLVLGIDRAGFNSGDGATHHGVFDVALLSAIPGVRIFAPVSQRGLSAALDEALRYDGVSAIRYPNGSEQEQVIDAFYGCDDRAPGQIGVRVWGDPSPDALSIVTHGRIAASVLDVAKELREGGRAVRVLLCEYLTPYADLSAKIAPLLGQKVLFVEEEVRAGGFGMNLADALCRAGALDQRQYAIVAADDGFATPVAGQSVAEAAGVDAASILSAAQRLLQK